MQFFRGLQIEKSLLAPTFYTDWLDRVVKKALSSHFIRQPWASKTFPIRQPIETCKFTSEMLFLGYFGQLARRSITVAGSQTYSQA